jgi:hypothetical protein
MYASRNGQDDLNAADEQFQLALKEALEAGLDTEIGHLHRQYAYLVLKNQGKLNEAAVQFQKALVHDQHPLFSYWYSLSARELGNIYFLQVAGSPAKPLQAADPRSVHLTNPARAALRRALEAYNDGRDRFDRYLGSEIIPIARAVGQQMFRSYTDNAVQIAMDSKATREMIAEIEASGPRYATEVVAEGRAVRNLADPHSFTRYQSARAVFHKSLASITEGWDLDTAFQAYLDSVSKDHDERQYYMRTRNSLTLPVSQAHLSDEMARRLLELRLPNIAFLLFHAGRRETLGTLVDAATGNTRTVATDLTEQKWQACHEAYRNAVKAACVQDIPERFREHVMCQALDDLLATYEEFFGGLFVAVLPLINAKYQVKIFPRFFMNEVPLHALSIAGKRLIRYADVSYAPTLGMFFQVHQQDAGPASGTLAAIHNVEIIPYTGMFRMLQGFMNNRLRVLTSPSWPGVVSALEKDMPSDLFFACHGQYDPEDPSKSWVKLSQEEKVSLGDVFSGLDLSRCRSVVLGACESGLVRTLVSAEYIGLPIAFFAAGVRSSLAHFGKSPKSRRQFF